MLEDLHFLVVMFSASVMCGAGAMLGAKFVCDLFKWSPVCVHTHVYNYKTGATEHSPRGDKEPTDG